MPAQYLPTTLSFPLPTPTTTSSTPTATSDPDPFAFLTKPWFTSTVFPIISVFVIILVLAYVLRLAYKYEWVGVIAERAGRVWRGVAAGVAARIGQLRRFGGLVGGFVRFVWGRVAFFVGRLLRRRGDGVAETEQFQMM